MCLPERSTLHYFLGVFERNDQTKNYQDDITKLSFKNKVRHIKNQGS